MHVWKNLHGGFPLHLPVYRRLVNHVVLWCIMTSQRVRCFTFYHLSCSKLRCILFPTVVTEHRPRPEAQFSSSLWTRQVELTGPCRCFHRLVVSCWGRIDYHQKATAARLAPKYKPDTRSTFYFEYLEGLLCEFGRRYYLSMSPSNVLSLYPSADSLVILLLTLLSRIVIMPDVTHTAGFASADSCRQ